LTLAEFRLGDIPKEVSIEMAIRLAKKYGGEESGRFVNGVLAHVVRQKDADSGLGQDQTKEPIGS
jgi:N utilization substance protein B